MSKHILIVSVNYNSYKELDVYLHSIEKAVSKTLINCEVDVYVADNSSRKEVVDISSYCNFELNIIPLKNLGYFGGAFHIINNLVDISVYNYVIISNVDVSLSTEFFNKLLFRSFSKDVAWIAPSIYSTDEHRDRNPKIVYRYSKKRLSFIYCMYKFPFLHALYQFTLYKRKKIRYNNSEKNIYAGHGSFIVLTEYFFNKFPKLNYPIFLFGEELFLAELIQEGKMRVVYIPDIQILDGEHVSTSKMKHGLYYKCNKEAIQYILKTFYE